MQSHFILAQWDCEIELRGSATKAARVIESRRDPGRACNVRLASGVVQLEEHLHYVLGSDRLGAIVVGSQFFCFSEVFFKLGAAEHDDGEFVKLRMFSR